MKKIFILLVFFVLCILAFLLFFTTHTNSPVISVQNVVPGKNVIPGKTTEQEIISLLGKPDTIQVQNDNKIISYKVPTTTRMDTMYIKDNKVTSFVKEISYDNTLLNDFTATHQKEDGVLYDSLQRGTGFTWHIFAKEGTAFLASDVNGYTLKVIYFSPMTYQNFLQTTAKTFSLSPVPLEDQEKF